MSLADDQEMVEAFTAHGADETFGEPVGPWRPYRRLDHRGADVGEHRVERSGELRVAIADQELERAGPLAEVHDQVACLLRDPRACRMAGNAEDVDASGVELDHEEHMQPSEQDSVDVEEVAGQQAVRLGAQELLPTRTRAPWRRRQTCRGEDPAHRALPHAVSEPDRFALNPAVAPSGVLPRQAQHQITDFGGDRRTSWRVRVCPVPSDQPAMPGQ